MNKLFSFFKSRKFLIFVLVIFVASIGYVIYASLQKPPPSSSAFPINVYPPDGSSPTLLFPATAVTFFFERPINPNLYQVRIDPKIDFRTKLGSSKESLNIFPTTRWSFDTLYTISLYDSNGTFVAKTTVTFKDPKTNPPLLDEHPPGGI